MSTTFTSRREFIKTSSLLVGTPLILPSRVWAADTAPGQRLALGCIGMGKMMRGHLRSLVQRKEVEVVAVCDVDTTRRTDAKAIVEKAYAAKAGAGYRGCTAYNDFRELLARKDIDAVVIATPDHWHALIAIAAVRAGKDVYCEKPLTYNVHEAVELVKEVRRHNRVFQTGSQQRSSKEFRIACELVRNGVIGRVSSITTSFSGPPIPYALPEEPMEPGLDWDLWCGPAPRVVYNSVLSPRGVHDHFPHWRKMVEFGGGGVTDWGAHHVDIAQWALNVDGLGPVEVRAPQGSSGVATDGAQLIYGDGTVLTHTSGNGIVFSGSTGEIRVNRGKFHLTIDGKTVHKFWDKETTPDTSLERELAATSKAFLANAKIKLYESKNHWQDFLDCVKARRMPICDVATGASSVISCHLLNIAYLKGASFKWNPKTKTFAAGGDPKWLTRDSYRGPWKV